MISLRRARLVSSERAPTQSSQGSAVGAAFTVFFFGSRIGSKWWPLKFLVSYAGSTKYFMATSQTTEIRNCPEDVVRAICQEHSFL